MKKSTERENFGTPFAAVLAMAGSAIGLGNIWRFPYVVGQNGAAAFIVVYLLCMLFLALPILLSESIIGRCSQQGTIGALETLAPGTKWKWLGYLTIITPMIILSYYSVVGGWSIEYFGQSLFKGFNLESGSHFGRFISSVWMPLACHTAFLLLTAIIILRGVKAGIEKFNTISMPVLFVTIMVIAVYSLSLPGAWDGVLYLVRPDFSKINGKAIASAMGQSFFSLSLGVGTILTYSSYMKKEASILRSGIGTAGFDLLFAVISGFAIMPAVFAADIEPDAGPTLIFETLPFIFAKMGAAAPLLSRIVSILFFFIIVVAALTSSISIYEVGVAHLTERRGMSRRKAVVAVFALTWTIGALCSLSFGPLSGIQLFNNSIFSFCDKMTSNYLMTFGGLLFVIFVGWKMPKSLVRKELTNDGSLKFSSRAFGFVYFFIRFVAPLVMLTIFVTNLMMS